MTVVEITDFEAERYGYTHSRGMYSETSSRQTSTKTNDERRERGGEELSSINVCSKSFAYNREWTRIDCEMHSCEVRRKSFAEMGTSTTHTRTHNVCDKAFADNSNLVKRD